VAVSIEELKAELANLDAPSRRHLIGFLVCLNDREDPEHMAKMERMIDDKDPSHWVSLGELERRLSLSDDERSN
jgi:hypothetical protein